MDTLKQFALFCRPSDHSQAEESDSQTHDRVDCQQQEKGKQLNKQINNNKKKTSTVSCV